MTNRPTMLALLAGTALFSFASSAFALDGNDVLAKLNAATAASNITISADEVATDGTTVTLTGAKVAVAGAPETVNLGDVTMEGVEEADGGYTVETVSFADVDINTPESSVKVSDISVSGLSIPAAPDASSLAGTLLYDNFHTGPIEIGAKGKKVIGIEEIDGNLAVAEDESSLDFDAAIKGISADLSQVEDAQSKDAIEKLGLTSLKGAVTLKGAWTLGDGKLDLSEYAFDFENIGRLNVALSLSGYTLDFIKSMQEATKAAATNPDKAAGEQALGMAMMGLMQQLSYNGASIRFDDAGITKKALDYAGSMQGQDGKQMAEGIKAMAPMMLGSLNMPDLQAQITTALNAYLDDPKSIEINATPAQPLPFPQIMGAGMAAPQTLPQVLNVKVTANQ